ncbi:unnamed protein product, partial [Chrysoparadoxa australica]
MVVPDAAAPLQEVTVRLSRLQPQEKADRKGFRIEKDRRKGQLKLYQVKKLVNSLTIDRFVEPHHDPTQHSIAPSHSGATEAQQLSSSESSVVELLASAAVGKNGEGSGEADASGYCTGLVGLGGTMTGKSCCLWGKPAGAMARDGLVQHIAENIFQLLKKHKEYQWTGIEVCFYCIYGSAGEVLDLLNPFDLRGIRAKPIIVRDCCITGAAAEGITYHTVASLAAFKELLYQGLGCRRVFQIAHGHQPSLDHLVMEMKPIALHRNQIIEEGASPSHLGRLVVVDIGSPSSSLCPGTSASGANADDDASPDGAGGIEENTKDRDTLC